MKPKHWGVLAAILGAFVAGSKSGVEYAKRTYVSRDRKFIEGEVIKNRKKANGKSAP